MFNMAEVKAKEFLDYEGLKTYDDKIKEFAQGVADKVKSDLIDGAPDTYDTLKEISEYIKTHQDEYSALQALVGDKAAKSDLESAVARILALKTKTSTLETTVNKLDGEAEVEGSVKKQIADAKTETETKITALENGKVATNTRDITNLKERVNTLETSAPIEISTEKITQLFTPAE